MSSTNRGAVRTEFDYYVTPVEHITTFLKAWAENDRVAAKWLNTGCLVLDPCAGGNLTPVDWVYKPGKPCSVCGNTELKKDSVPCPNHNGKPDQIIHLEPTPMSYPTALQQLFPNLRLSTIDIREDSPADDHGNFLDFCYAHDDARPDIIIFNPPFSLAIEFIQHALKTVKPGGFVVALLRLNFFGSKGRKPFFDKTMPMAHYIHHERMGFTPDGGQDSIEYMHAVWQQGWHTGSSIARVI
jgi:hypothetical protein